MNFIDKVKSILLENNEREISNLETKIKEIEIEYSEENEAVQRLQEESKEANKEKLDVQKKIISKKELEELKVIYEFVANYSQIKRITERIRHAAEIATYTADSIQWHDNPVENFYEEVNYRQRLCGIVGLLNEDINRILKEEKKENEETSQLPENFDGVQENKKSFFSRFFKKKRPESETSKKQLKFSNARILFENYKTTIKEFKDYYNSFLLVTFDKPIVVDKNIATILVTNVNNIITAQKRNIEITEEDEIYLDEVQPHELWREITRYYTSTSLLVTIIQNFEKRFEKIEKLYEEKPDLFNLRKLESIFEENDQMVVDLRNKNKIASSKSSEFIKKKKDEKEKKAKLRELESKKSEVKKRNKKIKEAKTLKELGYKNKEDATRKLSIDTKDYVVIPIPATINTVEELFVEEKKLKVEVDGQTYFTSYSNDVATGLINSIKEDANVDSVLMIPIKNLKKEDIDSVKSGKIILNKSVLQRKDIIALIPEGKSFNFEIKGIEVRKYSFGKISTQVRRFFEEDFVYDSDETENYDIFKGIKNISSKEKHLRKAAVIKCLIENVRKTVVSTDEIRVNGKTFFINKEDEKEIIQGDRNQPLNEKLLLQIVDEIQDYLIEDERNGVKIDTIYQKLLTEYMRINKKVKAEYYEEDETTVTLNNKKISIKPILPAKDESVKKKYSRPKEDVVYKSMKLAALINRFAHITENQELQNVLFDTKLDLIESAIDLSKHNPKINLKKKFDPNKMVMSVVLEIPGYNMIALHVMNKSNSLTHKTNRLEEHEDEIMQTAMIQIPGVNKELLVEMKKMSEEERMKFLLELEPNVFYKLAIRMGYTSEKNSVETDKKKFIKRMISDKNLEELLKESEELEK